MFSSKSSSTMLLLSLFAAAPSVLAQTYTDCNPLNRTDCPDMLALSSKNYTMDFLKDTPSDKVWNTTAGKLEFDDLEGAEFTINEKGDSPTVKSNFYIFFGTLEVIMKAAPGQGVVSSIVLQSECLDEVDWEWIGGNHTHVQSNYFGKGDVSSYDRAVWHEMPDPMADFHNYTVDWSREKLDWYLDGKLIRTLKYEDAQNGTRFPQTPMNVRLGIWAGGDPDQPKGVREWSGGEIDYKEAPFTMAVKSVTVSDASNATSYRWGDKSGSWESIELLQFSKSADSETDDGKTTSTKPIELDGNGSKSASQSASERWNGLSKSAQIGIAGSVAGVSLIGIVAFAFCCMKQRRAGRKERELADQAYEKQTNELLAYRAQMHRTRTEQMGMTGGHGHGIAGRVKRLSQSLGISRQGGQNPYHVI